jgi:hypothetical protein
VGHGSPTRSALAEITLAQGQLEVIVARLGLMATRPDFASSRVDILDAAHQTQRALLSVRHARSHVDATTLSHADSADQSDSTKPSQWFG